jgi:hypothetical protein
MKKEKVGDPNGQPVRSPGGYPWFVSDPSQIHGNGQIRKRTGLANSGRRLGIHGPYTRTHELLNRCTYLIIQVQA